MRLAGITREVAGVPPLTILRGIDLEVRRGDYVAILGPSGSGKSTLLNVIGLLDRASSGEFTIDGLDANALSETDRTALRGRRIGFVFQEFHLLSHRTARENVGLGALYTGMSFRDRVVRADELLDAVGLAHRADSFPSVMSGGERQRVAIARALMTDPSLLLCDEPTGNLDSSTAGQILDLFDSLHARGTTMLVITHDATTASRAERRLSMHDGRLGAAGVVAHG